MLLVLRRFRADIAAVFKHRKGHFVAEQVDLSSVWGPELGLLGARPRDCTRTRHIPEVPHSYNARQGTVSQSSEIFTPENVKERLGARSGGRVDRVAGQTSVGSGVAFNLSILITGCVFRKPSPVEMMVAFWAKVTVARARGPRSTRDAFVSGGC